MSAGLVAGTARLWTAMYTAGLPHWVRERRRGEIESDLYEHRAVYTGEGIGSAIVTRQVARRLFGGIPQDVLWRLETDRDNEYLARDGGVAPFPFVSAVFIGAVVVLAAIFAWVPVHSWQILAWLMLALTGVALTGIGTYASSFWPRAGAMVLALGTAATAWGLWWTYIGPLLAVYVGVTGITRARRIEALKS
jgi:hypothetical protein